MKTYVHSFYGLEIPPLIDIPVGMWAEKRGHYWYIITTQKPPKIPPLEYSFMKG